MKHNITCGSIQWFLHFGNRTKQDMVDLGVPLKECNQQEQNQIMS